MTGTIWTSPGAGATVKELDSAASNIFLDDELAAIHLTKLERKHGSSYQTNLALSGEELDASDLVRIADCK